MTQDLTAYLVVIKAARNRLQTKDFVSAGRLAISVNQNYDARNQALSELLIQGLVTIDGSRLALGTLTDSPWLVSALRASSNEAWEIVDAFPKRSRKFQPDQELKAAIGLEGEKYIINELLRVLPKTTHHEIRHISLTDDSVGFDISTPSVDNPDRQIYLEVKTTTRPNGPFHFYLTRNEFETAKATEGWYLVLVRILESKTIVYGHLEGSSLISYFPVDSVRGFSWTIAEGTLNNDGLRNYLP